MDAYLGLLPITYYLICGVIYARFRDSELWDREWGMMALACTGMPFVVWGAGLIVVTAIGMIVGWW